MGQNEARRAEVLIVDDTVASLDLLGELLAGAGYGVRPAQDGRMALRSARAEPPDLILLDVRMPGIDGYEVCRQLKADARTADVPVIFLSALRDTSDKVRGFGLGAVDYIAKPFQPEEVLARVRTHVELRRLQTRLEERVAERTARLQQSESELRESRARLQELAGFLQTVREEERTGIARELHDELGQALTALRIDLGVLRRDCAGIGEAARARVAAAHGLVEQIIGTLRRISEGLRPGALDVLGLSAAIEFLVNEFTERSGVDCRLAMDRDEFEVDDRVAIAVFRLVQESLTNVSRHARASRVDIDLRQVGTQLCVEVRDDGVGIGAESGRRGFGLLGMRERVAMLGGAIDISGVPGSGTRIAASIPMSMEGQT